MMPNLRTIGIIAVQLVLAALVAIMFAAGVTINGFSHRDSFVAAFRQYRANPTPEYEQVFEEERRLVLRDERRLFAGVAVVVFLALNAAVVIARRKLPGVVTEGTFGACAAWMIVGALFPGPGLPGHWRAGGKIVWGTSINAEWNTAIGMSVGLVLGLIPAMGRWWKSRRQNQDPSTAA